MSKCGYVRKYDVGHVVDELVKRGYTAREVAESTDVPLPVVRGALRSYRTGDMKTRMSAETARRLCDGVRAGIRHLPSSPVSGRMRKDYIRFVNRLHAGGMCYSHIAEVCGVDAWSVSHPGECLTRATWAKVMSKKEDLEFDLTGKFGTAKARTRAARNKGKTAEQAVMRRAERLRAYAAEHEGSTLYSAARELGISGARAKEANQKYHVFPKRESLSRQLEGVYAAWYAERPDATVDEAAEYLGVSATTVYTIRKRLGLSRRPPALKASMEHRVFA